MREKTIFQTRAYDNQYIEEIVELLNAAEQAISGKLSTTVEELRNDMLFPGFNPESDVRLFFNDHERLVGYAELWDLAQPHVRLRGFGAVHPQFLGMGVGSQILEWLVQRSQVSLPLSPADAQVVLHNHISVLDQAALKLHEIHGFSHVRSSYRMRIDFVEPPAAVDVVQGIQLRRIENDEDLRLGLLADFEAFQDHWGFVPNGESFDAFYKRMAHFLTHDPYVDLKACFLAMDGDEVAGVCLNSIGTIQDDKQGWVNILGVRRAWRKRGIGLALLRTSFNEFVKRGMTSAGLGVDSENLTGALRLYTQAGMQVEEQFNMYEKVIRPGKVLMNCG
ncbi:MAG: GNAT family N-acetyltransferase [Bellilinea sp.]|jgi:ribosomal protein S18 acetylase RimI-like enzyme